MMIHVSEHAAERAKERLGWDADRVTDTLRALTLKTANFAPLQGIGEIKVNGVLLVCALRGDAVVVVTVV